MSDKKGTCIWSYLKDFSQFYIVSLEGFWRMIFHNAYGVNTKKVDVIEVIYTLAKSLASLLKKKEAEMSGKNESQ